MTKSLNKQAVFFDLDGTLLDTMPDFLAAIKTLLKEENLPIPTINEKKFKSRISFGAKEVLKYVFNMIENSSKFSDDLLKRFLYHYQHTNHQHAKPFPGITDLLNTLNINKITWGIVTNKPTFFTEQIVNCKTFLQKASIIVSGDTTKYEKPHPEPLNFASSNVKIPNSNCIYIGDAERDIIAGNAAGMKTVTAMYGYISNESIAKKWPASYIVSTVADLSSLLTQYLNLKRA